MEHTTLIWLGLFLVGYALLGERIARGPLTLPLVAVAIGLAASSTGAVSPILLASGPLVEVTLGLLLFTGGARSRSGPVRSRHRGPLRLLLVALPLSILLGTVFGAAIFPGISLEAAAVLGAALAATDTGLCAPALRPPREAEPLSSDLRLEEGLSDGIAVAFVELALSAYAFEGRPLLSWLTFAARHVGLAAVIGLGVGLAGGWAVGIAQRLQPLGPGSRSLGGAGLAIVAVAAAGWLGTSGPTAAFVAGLAIARVTPRLEQGIAETDPFQGYVLFQLAFVTMGATIVPKALARASWRTVAYAAASLTVVRAIPVFLSFLRSGVPARDVAFVAWFGPRGLASILTARVLLERSDLPGREVAIVAVVTTVAASVVLHGVTAAPLARLRARLTANGAGGAPRTAADEPHRP